MSAPTDREPARRRLRPGHLLFIVAIQAYAVWYVFDAVATVESLESAMAVIVCAGLAVLLGIAILAREALGRGTAGREENEAGDAEPLANPLHLAGATVAYVLLIIAIGIEVPTFLFLAVTAWLLGSRSFLFIAFYAAALTGLLVWMVYFFATPPDAYFRLFG